MLKIWQKRIVAIATVALSSVFILSSCGGGGGNSKSRTIPAIVRPEVKVVPDTGTGAIVATTGASVMVAGAAPDMSTGSILVSGEGEGLLRKVIAKSASGPNTLLQTEDASLEQVFEQADIRVNTPISGSDFQAVGFQGGATKSNYKISSGPSDELKVTFTNLAIGTENGSAEASLSGSATLKLSLGLEMDVRAFQLKRVRWMPSVSGTVEAKLSVGSKVRLLERQIPISPPLATQPITVIVGGVPIVFVPVVRFYAVVSGDLERGLEVTSDVSVSFGAGAEWKKGQGSRLVGEVTSDANFQPLLNEESSFTFGLAPARPELKIKVYGVDGPYLEIDNPRIEAEFKSQANPRGYNLKVGTLFTGTVGFKMKVLSLLEADFSTSIERRKNIFDRFFPYGTSEPNPTSTPQPTATLIPEPTPTPSATPSQAVRVRLTNIDDNARAYANGNLITEVECSEDTCTNDSGWLTVTDKMHIGINTVVFALDNGAYGGWHYQFRLEAGSHTYDSGYIVSDEGPQNGPVRTITLSVLVDSEGRIESISDPVIYNYGGGGFDYGEGSKAPNKLEPLSKPRTSKDQVSKGGVKVSMQAG
jgi:hypothetical protein